MLFVNRKYNQAHKAYSGDYATRLYGGYHNIGAGGVSILSAPVNRTHAKRVCQSAHRVCRTGLFRD